MERLNRRKTSTVVFLLLFASRLVSRKLPFTPVFCRGLECESEVSSQRRRFWFHSDMILGRWDHVPAFYFLRYGKGLSQEPSTCHFIRKFLHGCRNLYSLFPNGRTWCLNSQNCTFRAQLQVFSTLRYSCLPRWRVIVFCMLVHSTTQFGKPVWASVFLMLCRQDDMSPTRECCGRRYDYDNGHWIYTFIVSNSSK